MVRQIGFEIGEWYHCFTRGIDGRETFRDVNDYERFLSLIYAANSEVPVTLFNERKQKFLDILKLERKGKIVAVGAYCLMPNHYHLLLKEKTEKGISRFMQKLGTGYVMYFNLKYQRLGNLFAKPFRAKYLSEDAYFQRVVSYIHLNPAELFEPGWKEGVVKDMQKFQLQLGAYPYSSLKDYEDRNFLTGKLIDPEVFEIYQGGSFLEILSEARGYYQELHEVTPQY